MYHYTKAVGRPVAATEPWKSGRNGPKAEPIQLACMRTALGAIEAEPAVLGAFLWKWFPTPNRRGDFRRGYNRCCDFRRGDNRGCDFRRGDNTGRKTWTHLLRLVHWVQHHS